MVFIYSFKKWLSSLPRIPNSSHARWFGFEEAMIPIVFVILPFMLITKSMEWLFGDKPDLVGFISISLLTPLIMCLIASICRWRLESQLTEEQKSFCSKVANNTEMEAPTEKLRKSDLKYYIEAAVNNDRRNELYPW